MPSSFHVPPHPVDTIPPNRQNRTLTTENGLTNYRQIIGSGCQNIGRFLDTFVNLVVWGADLGDKLSANYRQTLGSNFGRFVVGVGGDPGS